MSIIVSGGFGGNEGDCFKSLLVELNSSQRGQGSLIGWIVPNHVIIRVNGGGELRIWVPISTSSSGQPGECAWAVDDPDQELFVVFTLPVAERSLRKQAMNPKKLHAIDWALAYSFVAEPNIDVGKKLETAVFLHWRRQREDLGYLAGDREVDLVVNREHPEQLINVAYSVSQARTWEREIAALEEGVARFPRAERVLVAHERTSRKPPAGVEVVDAWRYLLAAQPPRGEPHGRK